MARPQIDPDSPTTSYLLKLPSALKRRAEEAAEAHGIKLSELTRNGLEREIRRLERQARRRQDGSP